jgi:hypothetical protein
MDAHKQLVVNNARFVPGERTCGWRLHDVAIKVKRSAMTGASYAVRWQVNLEWTPSVGAGEIQDTYIIATPCDQNAGAGNRNLSTSSVTNNVINASQRMRMACWT